MDLAFDSLWQIKSLQSAKAVDMFKHVPRVRPRR
jgi:hypothetical protein